MRKDELDRRQSVIARLVELRRDGRLTGQIVRSAAASLDVHPRSVWRWLADGEYQPMPNPGWRVTPEAIEAFYRAGGRPTVAWKLMCCEEVAVPSHAVFCRALRRDLSEAERAYARHGEDGRRRFEVYRRWEPSARNEVWETDHAQLDLEVLPLRGQRRARPWLTVVQDSFSRVVMGWAHRLAAAHRGVVVASLAPDSRSTGAVAWAILRALGKRSDHLGRMSPRWPDVERWLDAHRIDELIVLRAHHLKPDQAGELRRIAGTTRLGVTLVYSGDRASAKVPGAGATNTITDLLTRPRPGR